MHRLDLAAVPAHAGEGARLVETLDQAAVHQARVEAGAEIEEVGEGAILQCALSR
jgi:hypothetical protein